VGGAAADGAERDFEARRGMVYSRSLHATDAVWRASESCLKAWDKTVAVSVVAMVRMARSNKERVLETLDVRRSSRNGDYNRQGKE